ncbi:CRTAC1 family protein [Colwelliaceae bacterium MEBiC 14330]
MLTTFFSNADEQDSKVVFVESAIEKGLIFEHNERDYELSGLKDTAGNGICIIDFDNDGYEDIFAVAGRGVTRRYGKKHWWNINQSSKLFRNIQGSYFHDVTSIVNTNEVISGYGCATGDFNNDGYLDLVVGGQGSITVLINHKGERFNLQKISLEKNTWPMSITLWDANDDNYLDILVANFAKYTNDLKVGSQDYGYQTHTQFDSENFGGQENVLLMNTSYLQKNSTVGFTITKLQGYDKSLSITPLSLLTKHSLHTRSDELLVANAKGSTSLIQRSPIETEVFTKAIMPWLNNIKTPLVQANSINIANEANILLTQHQSGGFLLYKSNAIELDDLSWQLGINSDGDNVTPSWGTLVADFNNDGMEDIISARGFSTPHIDTPFKPQGSRNSFKIQTAQGTFSDETVAILPQLARASKGAAFADFNNDGLLDVIFSNNNNNLSLYMNKSKPKSWLSLTCSPLFLCENSSWVVSDKQGNPLATERFSKNQPFLSSNQKRLHFTLNDFDKNVDLSIHFNDKSVQRFADISLNTIYRIDVKEASIEPSLLLNSKQRVKPLLASLVNASLEELLPMLAMTPQLSIAELTKLAQYMKIYKLDNNQQSTALSPEFITITSWLLNQALQYQNPSSELMALVIYLVGSSESSLFSDHMVYLIETLQENNFCLLTNEIFKWYVEEETATKSKQIFKAPLIYKIIKSRSAKEIICGLHAISVSRDTTLGSSLLTLLQNNSVSLQNIKSVQAATVRTLGQLKNNKISQQLLTFCQASKDSLILAECIISLNKLGINDIDLVKLYTVSESNRLILTLHPDKVILAPLLKDQLYTTKVDNEKTFDIDAYLLSPLLTHRMLAHLVNLSSAQSETERVNAMEQVLLSFNKDNLSALASRWHSLAPDTTSNYFFLKDLPVEKLTWLIPYADKATIERMITHYYSNNNSLEFAYVIAQQCQLKQSLQTLCELYLSLPGYIKSNQVEDLLEKSIIKVIYALMSSNLIKRKATTVSLFNHSMQLLNRSQGEEQEAKLQIVFSLLRVKNLYTSLNPNQITPKWLNKFIHYNEDKHLKLDKDWLEQQEKTQLITTEALIQLIKTT